MYGLPRDIDLNFLVGAELIQVCIGSNEVILRFFESISVTIETPIRVVRGSRDVMFEEMPLSTDAVVQFLSESVVSVVGREDGLLTMTFSSGGIIEIADSSSQYESYQIQTGDRIIVV